MAADNPRRSDRVSLSVPIQVCGTEVTGEDFIEDARTLVINRHGATIVLKRKLAPVQQILIRRLGSEKEATARVVGQIGGQPSGYVYGIALEDPSVNLWNIEFPSMADSEKALARLLLECAACKTREVSYLDELEAEVFEVNRSLTRSCKHCQDWTTWKQCLIEAPAHRSEGHAQVSHAPVTPPPAPEEEPPSAKERRKDTRIQLNLTACIRQPGFGEEVVRVGNVSRGGLHFSSSNHYLEGSRVEVALPYTAGAANIFVPARIVRAREVPGKGLKEYGVAYMKPVKSRSKA